MKIAVTGANGYIGKHVIEALKKTKHTIIPVDINKTFNCITTDILSGSPQIYQSLLAPDALIHLAWKDGFNHNAESHIENLYSHFLFLKNMIDSGCSNITVMGTMHECGFIGGMIDDSTACNPLSLYGIAKNALRQMLTVYTKDKNISLKWLRAFYITGDDQNNKSVFSKILELAQQGKETFPFTSGKNKYDFIEINQLAEQISAASIQTEITGIINVCSGKAISLKDKVEDFLIQNNLSIRPNYGTFPDRPYDSKIVYGNTDKIKKILEKQLKNNLLSRDKKC